MRLICDVDRRVAQLAQMNNFKLDKKVKERGAALILIIVALPAIATIVAFVVNLSISNASIEQASSLSRLMALTAIEYFLETQGDSDTEIGKFNDRLNKTRDRINQVARNNGLVADPKEFINLELPWNARAGVQNGGIITPGIYFPQRIPNDEGVLVNPCKQANLQPPCFNPITTQPAGDPPAINAFRVDGSFIPNIPIKFFGSFLGAGSVPIRTYAISVAIPRNVIFITDISRSSVQDTHLNRPVDMPDSLAGDDLRLGGTLDPDDQVSHPERGRSGHYAYDTRLLNQVRQCAPSNNLASARSQYCNWNFIKNFNVQNNQYSSNAGLRRNIPADQQTKLHFIDDYESGGVIDLYQYDEYEDGGDDGPYNELHPKPGSEKPKTKFVSEYTDPNESYYIDQVVDPQPLTDIFNGLNSALTGISNRKRSGDKAGLIFIEKTLRWSRVVKLTDQFDYLTLISDTASPENKARIQKLGLFPTNEQNTNLTLALDEAFGQLEANPLKQAGIETSDAIVYIGDFLANCTQIRDMKGDINRDGYINYSDIEFYVSSCFPDDSNDKPAGCPDGIEPGQITQLFENGNFNVGCDDRVENFKAAMVELNNYVSTKLVPANITFSAVLIGDHIAPHTLDIQDPQSQNVRCLSEAEIRPTDNAFALGGGENGAPYTNLLEWNSAYFNMSSTRPFYEAVVQAYYAVRSSGGIFAPILRGRGGCLNNNTCTCQPDLNTCNNMQRRFLDRNCRTPQRQIQDALNTIVLGDSPYRIVETGPNS